MSVGVNDLIVATQCYNITQIGCTIYQSTVFSGNFTTVSAIGVGTVNWIAVG